MKNKQKINELKEENLLHVINSYKKFLKNHPITLFDLNTLKNIKKDKWIIHLSLYF